MAIAFLATLAAQMGAAWFNSSRNKAHSKKMALLQQAYEEKVTREGIENARAEFAELCAFQREMDAELQRDRLNLIQQNHQQNLMLDALAVSLKNWPLLVPPYVIANTPLISGNTSQQFIPLNCLLTTSTNIGFNNSVVLILEENLATFCSKYWNTSSSKSIRFLQEIWRDRQEDISTRHKDIYAHLSNVPTLLISPIIKNDTLSFRFYWWGLSTDPDDAHINDVNELNPNLSIPITKGLKFTPEIVETIVAECTPKLEAFISFFADLYYWNFYKVAPSLPILLSLNKIELDNEEIEYYNKTYSCSLEKFLQSQSHVDNLNDIIQGFAPCMNNKHKLSSNLIDYIKKLPDAKQSECLPALRTFSNLIEDSSDRIKISQLIDSIEVSFSRHTELPINWTVKQYETLNLLEVISICMKALPFMPACDTFHLLKRDDRLAIIAYFSSNGRVVSWTNNGIWVFQANQFYCPTELFGSTDRFSCKTASLTLVNQIIKQKMNNEDISAILDGQFEELKKELRPLASKLDDIFKNYIERVKGQIAQEYETKAVETINCRQVKYEDVVAWLRKAKKSMRAQSFDGAFIVKGKGGFFDKYPYKMYICLTLNRTPLTEANHPKGIIAFETTDDTLDDMFGANQNVQINFK